MSSLNQRKFGVWMGLEHNDHSLLDTALLHWEGLIQHPALGRNPSHNMPYHLPLDLLRDKLMPAGAASPDRQPPA